VDPAAFKGVYNFNLSLVGAQGKPEVLGALIDAFIASGGQELQVAVLDPAKLREAQAHPEGFGDLVVRIAGLNARFVELSRREQDEVIKRAECA
jgi:pyruvate-formate lyase